jgi:Mrp family chromosome partitioning ATPase
MIHLTLRGKGGVGKSMVASILAQYFRHRGWESTGSIPIPYGPKRICMSLRWFHHSSVLAIIGSETPKSFRPI